MNDFWSNVLASSAVVAVLLVAWLIFYYTVSFFSAKRRMKQITEFQAGLKKGQKVLFCGGFVGKITKIDGDYLDIEINKDNEVRISIFGVQAVLEDKEPKAKAK